MKTKKPNFRVKHPYQNLINSICMGLILLLSSILSVFVINSNTPGVGFVDAYGGNGSEERPYLIYNLDDLKNVSVYSKRSMVAGYGNSRRNFKLMADIDAADINGVVDNQFNGTFDGNNKTITSSMQVFNTIEKGSTVKNLNINLKFNENIFNPASNYVNSIYSSNIEYLDLINEYTGYNFKLEYSSNDQLNKAYFVQRFFVSSLQAQLNQLKDVIETFEELTETEQNFENYKESFETEQDVQLSSFEFSEIINIQKDAVYTSIDQIQTKIDDVTKTSERLGLNYDEMLALEWYENDKYYDSLYNKYLLLSNNDDVVERIEAGDYSASLNEDVLEKMELSNDLYTDMNIPQVAIVNYGNIENVSTYGPEDSYLYGFGGLVRVNAKGATISNCVPQKLI